jgi:hypothetical protein
VATEIAANPLVAFIPDEATSGRFDLQLRPDSSEPLLPVPVLSLCLRVFVFKLDLP